MTRRVLLLAADWAPGAWSGIGAAVAHQARALAGLGLEVEVLLARDEGAPPSPEADLRVRPLPRGSLGFDPRAFDLVHVHGLRLAELALELRARFGLPLVATVHAWPHVEAPRSATAAAWSRAQRRLLRACDAVVVPSRAERDLTLALVPEAAARTHLVAHGLPPLERRSPAPSPDGTPVVLFAGRFARSKGLDLLAEVVPRVLARRAATWVFAGGHGDAGGRATVERLATRFPAACRDAGWLDARALDALYARAALALVPSLYEPFGLAALEAQQRGAALLASDAGGLRDTAGDGSGGLRLRPDDPRAWTEAIVALLDDDGARRALGRRGPEWVKRRFQAAACARRLRDEVYAPLGAGARRCA